MAREKIQSLTCFSSPSILFSLIHSLGGFKPIFLMYALCLGFLLFLVAVDSNSIYKSMVVHGVYNASETLFKFNDDSMGKEHLFYANADMEAYQDKAYLIISAIAIIFFLYYLIKLHKKNPKWDFMRNIDISSYNLFSYIRVLATLIGTFAIAFILSITISFGI